MPYFTSRILLAAAAFVAVSLACAQRASAHGFEGDRFFPPTIQTDDPFATDEFSIQASEFEDPAGSDGTPKTREFDVTSEFDKEIFPKFAVGVSGTYINLEPENHQGPGQDGFDNVTLSAKYQLWEDAPHEWILSLGGEVDLGDTGSKALGVDAFSTYTPTLYFGKGFGDLPNELKYLKPFALTGTIGESIAGQPTNADGSLNPNALQSGLALEYSLLYLQEHVEDIGLPKPFSQMIPLVEFSATTPENRGGETTTGTISPGILWEQSDYQIGVEAVVPMNDHTGHDVGAVVSVQIYIDDIFPKVFGHPVFFSDENDNQSDNPNSPAQQQK
jgi:hypothetical protein